MKLIVGLGNPGTKYDGTRHNIGFAAIDYLLSEHGLKLRKESKFEANCISAEAAVFSEGLEDKLVFACPNTYMNHSGTAVQKLMQFYKITKQDLLVVHDDVSIDLGKLRVSHDRGAGGQHGVEDIIEKFGGAKDFYRLRIGVGPDPGGDIRGDYVLGRFPAESSERVSAVLTKSASIIVDWISGRSQDGTQYA